MILRSLRFGFLLTALMVCGAVDAMAACTTPDGEDSQTRYDFALHKMYVCNGTTWLEIPGGISGGIGCALDGVQVPNGSSFNFYSTQSHANCNSVRLSRACTNGTLSGGASFQYASCAGADTTPDAFSFTDVNASASSVTESNIIQINGIAAAADVAISNSGGSSPQWRSCSNVTCSSVIQSWTASPGTISSGQYIQVRITTAASGSANATLDVGGVTDTFTATVVVDTTPDAFSFNDVTSVLFSTMTTPTPATVTISGIGASTPVSVTGQGSPQISINGGGWVSWGNITNGQTLAVRLTSSSTASTVHTATISVGGVTDSWTVTTGGTPVVGMLAWGANANGKTGLGTAAGEQWYPAQVGSNTDWTVITAGGRSHSCGIRAGRLYCWGLNGSAATGLGTQTGEQLTPAQVGAFTDWTFVEAGEYHTCGIRAGMLYCWGTGTSHKLGLGSTGHQTTPAQVGAFTDWTTVAAGTQHSCGIRAGQLYCWGHSGFGKLGLGEGVGANIPTQVGTNTDWTAVSIGAVQTCGIRAGLLFCWGRNYVGQTGLGTTAGEQWTPAQAGSETGWTAVSGGNSYACGIRAGRAYCWGDNYMGKTGLASDVSVPTQLSGTGWTVISAGEGQTCGIRSGQLYCWGNLLGLSASTPKQIAAGNQWKSVAVGWKYSLDPYTHTLGIYGP